MANELTFITTWSPAEFKRKMNVSSLNIIRNPKTDLLFFQAPDNSDVKGAVSRTWARGDDTVISEVCPKEGGEAFYMLHKRNESDNVVSTL